MDYIKLKDKEYPFLFAIKAQREMYVADLANKDEVFFIYLGFKYGSLKEGKTFPFTEDGIVDAFEDDMPAYNRAAELLGEQMGELKKIKGLAMKGL